MKATLSPWLLAAAGIFFNGQLAGAQQFDLSFLESAGAAGEQFHLTDTTQQGAEPEAPRNNTDPGLARTFPTGPQGYQDTNGADLPETTLGVVAPASGFNRDACRSAGAGGFSGGGAKRYQGPYNGELARPGSMLPPTATSLVDLDITGR